MTYILIFTNLLWFALTVFLLRSSKSERQDLVSRLSSASKEDYFVELQAKASKSDVISNMKDKVFSETKKEMAPTQSNKFREQKARLRSQGVVI